MLTPAILTLVGAVGVLLGFAAGAPYGGRHAAAQSRRADREKQRANAAEREARVERLAADDAHQQLATLRAALRRTAVAR